MNNEQYYSVTLEDFATVSFVSGRKDYFGTLPEIEIFINALKTDHNDEEYFAHTVKAFEEFKSGKTQAAHHAAYNEVRLLTPVTVLSSVSYTLPAMEWEHLNIYNCPYNMRCASAEVEHIWFKTNDLFYRAMKARFTELEHDCRLSEYESEQWKTFGSSDFWGFPHIIEVEAPHVYNRLAVPEKWFKTEDDIKADIARFAEKPEPDFSAFCDDIFGDG